MSKSKPSGPEFIKFFGPLQRALLSLGGSASPREAKDKIIVDLNISENDLSETTPTGVPRIENRIDWARQYLVWGGYIDNKKHGVWALTEKGVNHPIDDNKSLDLFKDVREAKKEEWGSDDAILSGSAVEQEKTIQFEDHKVGLLNVLMKLPPGGFERICQRLLRLSGFAQVEVTGQSGDGGLDGHGILEINPLVSFKVFFQCKRYNAANPVSAGTVRDFRGAMMGRADKGIILTTGRFTQEARKEAVRDGAPPIELVDGEKLVELFERHELGLKPRTVYDVDSSFFDEYR